MSAMRIKVFLLGCLHWNADVEGSCLALSWPHQIAHVSLWGVDTLTQGRMELVCSICTKAWGACIQCGASSCCTAFHPLCARRAGYCMDLIHDEQDAPHQEPLRLVGIFPSPPTRLFRFLIFLTNPQVFLMFQMFNILCACCDVPVSTMSRPFPSDFVSPRSRPYH